jgi:peptide-methionine (S)-S-oxide reductase
MSDSSLAKATVGGGCFWCVEAVLERVQGVERVVSGYTGGHVDDPTYRQICTGTTGHAEVVQVTFDPEVLSYRDLLRIFFTAHDPTTLNRQGADVGTQYRSAIFTHSDAQRKEARAVIEELRQEGVYSDPIVTEVTPLGTFYPAEQYHQGYYRANPRQGYCRVVIDPKVAKLRQQYADRLKPEFARG